MRARTAAFGVLEGQVRSFDAHRGLGAIEAADGRRYPFHCAEIADGSREVEEGASVVFRVAPGHLGSWQAVAVEKR